ncbi:hypothetical protein M5K25_000634 [Dendrobium thyrsiflorum]|uniref:Uncharacterized protein n=1 Tax=Dendrobium thyrsiflorum TaxID=117978 RepID=A0ABD0VU26_DENTH
MFDLFKRLSSEYVNTVSGSLPSPGSGEKGHRFSAFAERLEKEWFSAFAGRLEGRAVLCRRKRLLLPEGWKEQRFSAGGRGCLCRNVGRNSGSLPEEEVAFAGRLEGTAVLCHHRGVGLGTSRSADLGWPLTHLPEIHSVVCTPSLVEVPVVALGVSEGITRELSDVRSGHVLGNIWRNTRLPTCVRRMGRTCCVIGAPLVEEEEYLHEDDRVEHLRLVMDLEGEGPLPVVLALIFESLTVVEGSYFEILPSLGYALIGKVLKFFLQQLDWNSGIERRSSGTAASGGGPAELRHRVVVRRNSSVRLWSSGTPTSGGDPVKLWRQAVVRRNSGVRRWFGGTPTSGGDPAKFQRQADSDRVFEWTVDIESLDHGRFIEYLDVIMISESSDLVLVGFFCRTARFDYKYVPFENRLVKGAFQGSPAVIKFRVPTKAALQEAYSTPIQPLNILADKPQEKKFEWAKGELIDKIRLTGRSTAVCGFICACSPEPIKIECRKGKQEKALTGFKLLLLSS